MKSSKFKQRGEKMGKAWEGTRNIQVVSYTRLPKKNLPFLMQTNAKTHQPSHEQSLMNTERKEGNTQLTELSD